MLDDSSHFLQIAFPSFNGSSSPKTEKLLPVFEVTLLFQVRPLSHIAFITVVDLQMAILGTVVRVNAPTHTHVCVHVCTVLQSLLFFLSFGLYISPYLFHLSFFNVSTQKIANDCSQVFVICSTVESILREALPFLRWSYNQTIFLYFV